MGKKTTPRTPERLAWEREYRAKNRARLNAQKAARDKTYQKTEAWRKKKLEANKKSNAKAKAKKTALVLATGRKTCKKCKVTRPVSDFRIMPISKDGRAHICLICKPAPIPKPRREPTNYKRGLPAEDGWVLVMAVSESPDCLKVWRRDDIFRWERHVSTGDYSPSVSTFSIVGDDSGERYKTLDLAERIADKMGSK